MKPKIHVIPGTMCNERLWEKLQALTADTFEWVHLPIPIADSIDAMAEDIAEQLPDNAILLGFSFGGYIAASIAAKVPERIQHLFVISNSPCALSNKELVSRQASLEHIANYGYGGINSGKALSFLDADSAQDELVKIIVAMDAEMSTEQLVNQLSVGSDRQDLALPLLASSVSITFVYSEDDELVNKTWMSDFTAAASDCSAVSIPGSGHMLPLEQPAQLLAVVRSVLGESAES